VVVVVSSNVVVVVVSSRNVVVVVSSGTVVVVLDVVVVVPGSLPLKRIRYGPVPRYDTADTLMVKVSPPESGAVAHRPMQSNFPSEVGTRCPKASNSSHLGVNAAAPTS